MFSEFSRIYQNSWIFLCYRELFSIGNGAISHEQPFTFMRAWLFAYSPLSECSWRLIQKQYPSRNSSYKFSTPWNFMLINMRKVVGMLFLPDACQWIGVYWISIYGMVVHVSTPNLSNMFSTIQYQIVSQMMGSMIPFQDDPRSNPKD